MRIPTAGCKNQSIRPPASVKRHEDLSAGVIKTDPESPESLVVFERLSSEVSDSSGFRKIKVQNRKYKKKKKVYFVNNSQISAVQTSEESRHPRVLGPVLKADEDISGFVFTG